MSANVVVAEDMAFLPTVNLLYLIYLLLKDLSAVYFQMKERELDYKKSVDQLLKDKEDANRQLKMMQEGEEFGSMIPTHLRNFPGCCVEEFA
jgi:cell division protein FtsL